jgi:hypothetical protein
MEDYTTDVGWSQL